MFKVRARHNKNIVKWILQGRKAAPHAALQKQKTLSAAAHQMYTFHGANVQLHRTDSMQVCNGGSHETHLLPGKYSIF